MVPVGVRGDQPDDVEAGLLRDRGSTSSSSGNTGESITNASLAGAHEHAPRRVRARGDRDDVGVQADGAHYAAPSSFAASSSDFTSAVGFFCDASSCSLWRLTQMTGIFAFTHGSTS